MYTRSQSWSLERERKDVEEKEAEQLRERKKDAKRTE